MRKINQNYYTLLNLITDEINGFKHYLTAEEAQVECDDRNRVCKRNKLQPSFKVVWVEATITVEE